MVQLPSNGTFPLAFDENGEDFSQYTARVLLYDQTVFSPGLGTGQPFSSHVNPCNFPTFWPIRREAHWVRKTIRAREFGFRMPLTKMVKSDPPPPTLAPTDDPRLGWLNLTLPMHQNQGKMEITRRTPLHQSHAKSGVWGGLDVRRPYTISWFMEYKGDP